LNAAFPCNATLRIDGPAGALEARTACPDPARATGATAIILHPHPRYGGTMQNKVVHTLAGACGDLGLASVRFNFRGVGGSAGEYGHGEGELADTVAVVEWVRARRPADAIWLAGFSFGGAVALRAAATIGAAHLITIAPAFRIFDAASYLPPPCPWLLVQGEADDVVPVTETRAFLDRFAASPQTVIVAGAGHFFHQRLNDLRHAVTRALGQ
jgi:alpha/beta superfamily hydrolase